jgi:hypothetical protein
MSLLQRFVDQNPIPVRNQITIAGHLLQEVKSIIHAFS